MGMAQEILTTLNDDTDLLKKVIFGETKAQSSQWKSPEEPVKCAGFVHCFFQLQCRVVNKKYYLEVISRLHNSSEMHRIVEKPIFGQKQNDNHASTTAFTGLVPTYFFLFPKLKTPMIQK